MDSIIIKKRGTDSDGRAGVPRFFYCGLDFQRGIPSLVEYIFHKVMIVIVVEGQGRCARID